jgi:hypothetical protein
VTGGWGIVAFFFLVGVGVGIVIGGWLLSRFEKARRLLLTEEPTTWGELAEPSPAEDALTFSEIKASLSPVPQFGLPETRFHYQGLTNCCHDGAEIRRGDSYVFIPLTNGVAGSGLIVCSDHAGEVAEHAEGLDDPADV